MNEIIFESENHKNILLEDYGNGIAVQANVHLIVHEGKALILDPGGHKVFNKAISNLSTLIKLNDLQHIFLSHQDPDIVAAVNGWLMGTDADAWCSECWKRFVPHFGVNRLVVDRLKTIPDKGMNLDLNGCSLKILPAHFMHSIGNFQLYDPQSKVLYSGDLGASLGIKYRIVENFDEHIASMEGFHKRYMTSNEVLKKWAVMVKGLDIEVIAPQHGAMFKGKEMVGRFIDWCENLRCGLDIMQDIYKIPEA